MDRQTDRETDRQIDRAIKWIDRIDIFTDRCLIDRSIERQTDRKIEFDNGYIKKNQRGKNEKKGVKKKKDKVSENTDLC